MCAATATVTLTATEAQAGFRADRALCALAPGLNRRTAKTLFHAGVVSLNEKAARGSERVTAGDRFSYPDPHASPSGVLPEKPRGPRLTTRHGRHVFRLYEDEAVLVLNKPAEVPVHRGQDGRSRRETLEDVLERTFQEYAGGPAPSAAPTSMAGEAPVAPPGRERRSKGSPAGAWEEEDESLAGPSSSTRRQGYPFFFVHRLDMETTGCLLIAKTEAARDALLRDFEERNVRKTYLAVVVGGVTWERRSVKRPLLYVRQEADDHRARAPRSRQTLGRSSEGADPTRPGPRPRGVKIGVALEEGSPRGKASETEFFVERRFKGYTLLRCEPKTGRMHQIRVHLAAEGFPLAYDSLYGRRSPLRMREFDPAAGEREAGERVVLTRLPLHASKLEFTHPVTGEKVCAEAPLPGDLKEFLRLLRKFRGR